MLLWVCKSIVALWKAAGAAQEAWGGFVPHNNLFSGLHAFTPYLPGAWISAPTLTQYSQAFRVTAGQNGADKHKPSYSCIAQCSISTSLG